MKKIFAILLTLLLIASCSSNQNLNPGVGATEYYRLDLKGLDKESSLGNLRIITKDYYELEEAKEKYNLENDYIVDEKWIYISFPIKGKILKNY